MQSSPKMQQHISFRIQQTLTGELGNVQLSPIALFS